MVSLDEILRFVKCRGIFRSEAKKENGKAMNVREVSGARKEN